MTTAISSMLGQLLRSGLDSAVLPFIWTALVYAVYGINGHAALEKDLPPLSTMPHRPDTVTRIYDRGGVLLAQLQEGELRDNLVKIADVPLLTRLAFVAIEDSRFYEHSGVDPRGMLRALSRNVLAGRVAEGGSTITQQLVKNRYLRPERTLKRKLQEITLAMRLEKIHSKDEILEQYLNEIFFGNGLYGIGTAARHYFGKKVSELSLAESAMLAGMVKAPNRFNPVHHPKRARERQQHVITRMSELGYVTAQQAQKARFEPLKITSESFRRNLAEKAPYFLSIVKKQLVQMYGMHKAFAGGLKVTTTLDWDAQQKAEKAFASAPVFKGRPDLQGAFLAVEPRTGDILALVGGRDWKRSQFNRAVQARRQPGSAYKPIIYAAAFAEGLPSNAIVEDEPMAYPGLNNGNDWEPRNYGDEYHGAVTLAEAMAMSYNSVAVKLLDQIGVEPALELSKRLGIASALSPTLGLALGGSDVTLLEMVSAYSAFANQGVRAEPRAILKVEDPEGRVLAAAIVRSQEAVDKETAFKVTQLLRGVVERGTGTSARVPGHPVAGKTGTTNRYTDAWFVGFTPEVACGAFVIHDDHRPLGGGKAGGRVAAPIVGAFLRSWLSEDEPAELEPPDTMALASVCGVTGLRSSRRCYDSWTLAFEKDDLPAWCRGHWREAEEDYTDYEHRRGPLAHVPEDGVYVDEEEPPYVSARRRALSRLFAREREVEEADARHWTEEDYDTPATDPVRPEEDYEERREGRW